MLDTSQKESQAARIPVHTPTGLRVPGVKGNDEDSSPYGFKIGNLYDGPLDALLGLIKKQNLNIYDLPIAQITKQFQAYARQLSVDELDTAVEFVHMAAQLILIKSQMLLPVERATSDGSTLEDPRKSLVEQLLQYEQVKQAAQMLGQMQMAERLSWTKPDAREFREAGRLEPVATAADDTIDLASIFRKLMERTTNRPALSVANDSVTAAQMVDYLRQRLEIEDAPILLTEAIGQSSSPRIITAAFVALLEMVRVGAVLLKQDSPFDNIRIKKTAAFEQAMTAESRSLNGLEGRQRGSHLRAQCWAHWNGDVCQVNKS